MIIKNPIYIIGTDVADTTATAADVLYPKEFYGADGEKATGQIVTYTGANIVTPNEITQVLPTDGKYMPFNITIAPIPSNYKDTTDTDAVAGDMLSGKKAVTGAGLVTGSIPTYDGATAITENGTIAVGGKYCPSNLTVNVPNNYAALANKTLTELTAENLAGATQIGAYTFYGCSALESVVIPSTVTSIGASAFEGCTGVLTYDFTASQAVPTLVNVSAFTGINANCKIIVPDALYDTWIVAQNWATYAPYIIKYSDAFNYIENGTLYANVGTATLTQGTLEVD